MYDGFKWATAVLDGWSNHFFPCWLHPVKQKPSCFKCYLHISKTFVNQGDFITSVLPKLLWVVDWDFYCRQTTQRYCLFSIPIKFYPCNMFTRMIKRFLARYIPKSKLDLIFTGSNNVLYTFRWLQFFFQCLNFYWLNFSLFLSICIHYTIKNKKN